MHDKLSVTMKRASSYSSYRGFTIVELLIVIIVIAILAAITTVAYSGIASRAKNSSAQTAAEQAVKKVLTYMVDNADQVPSNLAAAGIINQGDTTYQYSTNTNVTPQAFCVTATTGNVSYFANNTSQPSSVTGACPGHGVNGVPPVTNLVVNPSFEGGGGSAIRLFVGGNGVIPYSTFGYNWALSGTQTRGGANSLAVTAPATAGDSYAENQQFVTVPLGTYTFSVWVYLTGAGSTVSGRNVWYGCSSGSCTGLQNLTYNQSLLNQWQRISGTLTATAATNNIWVRLYGPTNATTYFDAIMITQGTSLYTYADGGSSNWIWNGASHNSTSTGSPL